MFYSFFLGVYGSFLYDLLRVFRRVIAHHSFWVDVEDLLFWMYCTVKAFLIMQQVNNGILRWFAIFGVVCGIVLYCKLISPVFVKYATKFFSLIKKWIIWLFKLILHPFAGACRYLRRLCRGVRKQLTFSMKKIRISLKR